MLNKYYALYLQEKQDRCSYKLYIYYDRLGVTALPSFKGIHREGRPEHLLLRSSQRADGSKRLTSNSSAQVYRSCLAGCHSRLIFLDTMNIQEYLGLGNSDKVLPFLDLAETLSRY